MHVLTFFEPVCLTQMDGNFNLKDTFSWFTVMARSANHLQDMIYSIWAGIALKYTHVQVLLNLWYSNIQNEIALLNSQTVQVYPFILDFVSKIPVLEYPQDDLLLFFFHFLPALIQLEH